MNKFEDQLTNWACLIQKYVSESSQVAQKLRRILRKNNAKSDVEEYIEVFGNSFQTIKNNIN